MEKFEILINGENSIEKTFRFTESGLKHAQDIKFKLLPFTANDKDYVLDFQGVVGAFTRFMDNKELNPKFDKTVFDSKLNELVNCSEDNREALLNIINSLYIKNDELRVFNVKSLNYVKSTNNQEKIADFLYTMFIEKEQKQLFLESIRQANTNVIHKLVFDSLPTLKDVDKAADKYFCALPYIKKEFQKDISFLMKNQELYEKNIKRLLEYYFMFYISQLTIKLSKFEKGNKNEVENIFMTLSWEVTSKTRQAYEYGWKYVREHIIKIFSHAITLEFLAHNSFGIKMDYMDAYAYFVNNEEDNVAEQISVLIEEYKKRITDVDFLQYNHDYSKDGNSKAVNKIRELYEIIDYQFNNSTKRRSAYRHYQARYVEFVQGNFGKRRGALGYNYNITEQDIILFTQIIIGCEGGRIRLVNLYLEFEKRGLLFDRYSKKKIVELYEKLNLLEKKSDSGDAQYVRSIL